MIDDHIVIAQERVACVRSVRTPRRRLALRYGVREMVVYGADQYLLPLVANGRSLLFSQIPH